MRRRRSVRRDDGITLFPFLAVLICTMGSLIVLLVVIVQQAKASAADLSRQRAQQHEQQDEQGEQLRLEQEELKWRLEVLRESRARTAEQLEDRRRELSHLEDVIRELQRKLELAAAEAQQIEAGQPSSTVDLQAAQQLRQQLQRQLQQAKEALAKARDELQSQKPSYAIVPYDGPHGTRRRPIFIECLEDRVVLQPEGIELTGDDFQEPITDDNPLASALRAKREYLADALRKRDGQPYPLLVVRPQGARAYAAARAAMKSWEAEFGYELIDDDLLLKYPQADAALVGVMRRAVQQSRARRRYLQAIAPARFGRTQGVLRPSRNGGFEHIPDSGGRSVGNGMADLQESAGGGWAPTESGSRGQSPTGFPLATTDSQAKPGDAGNGSGNAEWGGSTGESLGTFPKHAATSPSQRQSPPGTANSSGAGTGAASRSAASSLAGAPNQKMPTDGRGGSTSGTSTDSTGGGSSTTATGGADGTGPQGASSGDSQSGMGGRNGGNTTTATSGGQGGPASQGSTSGQAVPGGGGATSAQSLYGSANLSDTRGSNWALPQKSVGATGITRPIRLACYANRLVLLPEDRGREKPQPLMIEGDLGGEIDQLVAKIWQRMESWGIAGPGMYWKPVLVVQVPRTGEERYAELSHLLKDSGIVVKRKYP